MVDVGVEDAAVLSLDSTILKTRVLLSMNNLSDVFVEPLFCVLIQVLAVLFKLLIIRVLLHIHSASYIDLAIILNCLRYILHYGATSSLASRIAQLSWLLHLLLHCSLLIHCGCLWCESLSSVVSVWRDIQHLMVSLEFLNFAFQIRRSLSLIRGSLYHLLGLWRSSIALISPLNVLSLNDCHLDSLCDFGTLTARVDHLRRMLDRPDAR